MKEVFETYVENAFGDRNQSQRKIRQCEYNYFKYFPSDKNSAVLDIGVGRGEMMSVMKAKGYSRYLGIDISPSTIALCQSFDLNCVLVDDTVAWLQDRPAKFSLITLQDVLEHIPRENSIEFLRAMKNSLVDGGKCIIQVPNMQSPDATLHMYNDITHVCGYVEHSLSQILLVAGFKTVSFGGFEERVERSPKHRFLNGLRSVYWSTVRIKRRISTNISPRILHPVFYAVAEK